MSWSGLAVQGSNCSAKSSPVSSLYGTKASLQSHCLDISRYTTTKSTRALEDWILGISKQDEIRASIIETCKQFGSLKLKDYQLINLQSIHDLNVRGSGAWCLSSVGATNLPYCTRHAESSGDAFPERFYSLVPWSQGLLSKCAARASPCQEGESYRGTGETTSLNSEQHQKQQQRKGKRKRKDENRKSGSGRGHGGSDDEPPAKESQDEKLRLACPFFKRNPAKYVDQMFCLHHWPNTSRLKEHLYSQHSLEGIQCGLCGKVFKNELNFQPHQRQQGACEWRAFERREGIDPPTKQKLQDKGTTRGFNEKDKWQAIYGMLFPDDDRSTYPSPYFDAAPFRDQEIGTRLQNEIPSIVENAIGQVPNINNIGMIPDVNELQTIIIASINDTLQRLRTEQLSSRNIRAEVDNAQSRSVPSAEESTQALRYRESQMSIEHLAEFNRDAMEDLPQFHSQPGDDATDFAPLFEYMSTDLGVSEL
ncbi:hypothetical protein F5Y01DRAFT_66208 [Xylaria sp. FL0043]|nr:hypothetical protein F5Y01DRAFT_66208 [Xylaria sp. FL0043]